MKTARILVVGLTCLLAACSTTTSSKTAQNTVRSYNATASVGDFLTISIDSAAQTITYKNYTNQETGTVPYTVNANGTYTITDPNGNLLSAYEVPGFVMVVEAANAGPGKNTQALITAVESVPVTISTFAGQNFNYMQFRTAAGGLEVGTISIDAQGNSTHDGYWPFGVFSASEFNGGSFAASAVQEDPSGDFFTISEGDDSTSYAFGTPSGFFAVDTASGTILSLPKAASKSFDATTAAGTYTALYYEKANAQTGQGNVETGTPSEGQATVTITSAGAVTITDSQNNVMASGTLAAVADTSYLYDGTSNTLSDPLFGMFTFRTTTGNSQQDVFVSFQGGAVIFSSFETGLPIAGYAPYTYFYGVGLK
jgi:archaellum component FlaF (FlaF/FlaG flagellin family)